MASAGTYTIEVTGILNSTRIMQELNRIQAQVNSGAIAGATGASSRGGKKGQTVYAQAGRDAKQSSKQVSAFNAQTKKASVNLLDVGKKVVAFGAVTSAIQMATGGIASMVNNVVELDAQLTEFKKVSDLNGKALEDYTSKAYKAGEATAKTGVQMLEAATKELGRIYSNV